ncbi:hypothetical protein KW797_00470 [Candidatus Parcubacteria bacterium]|nr:hypothetical protein [Candidatus Parcubacteria bacterium]
MSSLEKRKKECEEFEKSLLVKETDLKERVAFVEEQTLLAKSWYPYAKEHKLQPAHERALAEAMSDTLLEAIEILAKERMRQFSNKAMVEAGDELRGAKPMWMSVGVQTLLGDILEAAKLMLKKEERDAIKEKKRLEQTPPAENLPARDVTHLYDNPRT